MLEVGVRLDDGSGVPAELERDARARCERLEVPADGRGTGERHDRYAHVADGALGVFVRYKQHRHRVADPGVDEDLAEQQRADRRRRRRLHDDRVAGAQRGRDLMRDQVQREVERRDAQHRPEREPARDPQTSALAGVQTDELTGEPLRFLAGERHRADRSIDFGCRVLPRLAAFAHDRGDQLFAPRFDRRCGVEQDARALPRVLLARPLERRGRAIQSLVHLGPRAHRNFVDLFPGVRVRDCERRPASTPLAGEQIRPHALKAYAVSRA